LQTEHLGLAPEAQSALESQVTPLGRELRASVDFFEHQQDATVSKVYSKDGDTLDVGQSVLALDGPAKAADVPIGMPVKAPHIQSVFDWTGLHIGAHAGFSNGEMTRLLRACFGRVESVGLLYYVGKYPRLRSLWETTFRFGLARFLAPSVYFRASGTDLVPPRS